LQHLVKKKKLQVKQISCPPLTLPSCPNIQCALRIEQSLLKERHLSGENTLGKRTPLGRSVCKEKCLSIPGMRGGRGDKGE
jgi:hypothetical protein